MKRRKLRYYLDKKWARAAASLRSYIAHGEAEALHGFRVQVKKIRAFIRLAENVPHPASLKKCFKPVRALFAKAGTIRDAQLRLSLAGRHGAGKEFLKEQRETMEAAACDLRSEGKACLARIRKSRRRLQKKIRPIANRSVRQFYKHQLALIAEGIAGRHSDTELHTCRKRIKVLIYDHKFARKVLKRPVNERYLERLEKALGEWHDNLLASRFFPGLKARDKRLRERIRRLAKDFDRLAIL